MKASGAFKVGPLVCRPHLRDGKPTGSWQMDIPPRFSSDGKRKRLTFSSRREVHDAAARLSRRQNVQASLLGQTALPSGILFAEVAKEWTDEQVALAKAGHKRASSVDTGAFQLKPLLAFMGTLDLEAITAKKVLDYQQHRTSQGRKPTTINSEVAKLKQVMSWAVDKKLCGAVPKVRLLPVTRRRLDLPSQTEMAQIISQLAPGDALLIRFFCETGCRKSEAFHLQWRDIDAERNLIHIRAKDGFTPKTAHSNRSIPVHPSLVKALLKVRGKRSRTSLVFPGKGGVVRTEIEKALNTAVRSADVKRGDEFLRLTHQLLRKAHASWQAMNGLPESVLQVRLGHVQGSRVTQEVYIHAAREREPDGILTLPRPRKRNTKLAGQ